MVNEVTVMHVMVIHQIFLNFFLLLCGGKPQTKEQLQYAKGYRKNYIYMYVCIFDSVVCVTGLRMHQEKLPEKSLYLRRILQIPSSSLSLSHHGWIAFS